MFHVFHLKLLSVQAESFSNLCSLSGPYVSQKSVSFDPPPSLANWTSCFQVVRKTLFFFMLWVFSGIENCFCFRGLPCAHFLIQLIQKLNKFCILARRHLFFKIKGLVHFLTSLVRIYTSLNLRIFVLQPPGLATVL